MGELCGVWLQRVNRTINALKNISLLNTFYPIMCEKEVMGEPLYMMQPLTVYL